MEIKYGSTQQRAKKEQVRKDVKAYLGENDNGEVDPTILWDALKAVMRGRLIADSALVKRAKLEIYKKNNDDLRELEREYQDSNNEEIYKKIKDLRIKIKTAQLDEIERKSKYVKQSYYETGARATKLLARRMRKQQALSNISSIRDPGTNKLVNEPEEIERRKYLKCTMKVFIHSPDKQKRRK